MCPLAFVLVLSQVHLKVCFMHFDHTKSCIPQFILLLSLCIQSVARSQKLVAVIKILAPPDMYFNSFKTRVPEWCLTVKTTNSLVWCNNLDHMCDSVCETVEMQFVLLGVIYETSDYFWHVYVGQRNKDGECFTDLKIKVLANVWMTLKYQHILKFMT